MIISIIVGCNSQDGQLLCEFLSKKKYELIGLGRNLIKCDWYNNLNPIDIINTKEVYDFIDHLKPDEIYHLAAIATGIKHTVLDFVKTTFGYLGLVWNSNVKEDSGLIKRKKISLVGNPTQLITVAGWKPSLDFNR